MGRTKGMSLVATLAVLVSIATASPEELESGPAQLSVTCGESVEPAEITVEAPNTTLTVTCPDSYTIHPNEDTKGTGEQQKVYIDEECQSTEALGTVCTGASATALKPNGYKLVFSTLEVPSEHKGFYFLCKPPPLDKQEKKECKVHVLIGKATPPGGGAGGPSQGPGVGPGTEDGPTGQEGTGGTAGVQTCAHANGSITISIPEKGSSVQFACESSYNLYPVEPNKVFSKDCKKQETLQDMTRTKVPAAKAAPGSRGGLPTTSPAEVPTYTLKADKKPAKKTLCYLCAKEETTPDKPGTAEDYCTIYVESGACTQSGLGLTLALMLPCVLAVLRFM